MGRSRGGRRKRWRAARWWLLGSALALLVVLGLGALLGWSAWGTYQQAVQVQRDATQVRAVLAEQRWEDVAPAVASLGASSQGLASSTDQLPWRVVESAPVVGASAQAVSELAAVLTSLTSASEPLLPFAQRAVDGQIRRADGSIDVDAMREVAAPLEDFTERVGWAADSLAGVDVARVRPEIGEPVAQLRTQLTDVLPTLRSASEVASWLPGLLGADGPRTWLVLLQNPAEARGSGGFIGGYVMVRTDDGAVSLTASGTSSQLAGQPIPADGAPADARETWGDALERWGAFNVSPHFPMTAELAAASMAAVGTPVDGVIAVDPQGVASLLTITGPVTARGKTITAADAAQFFTVDVYREYPDGQERDEVSMALVEATFQALLGAAWSPTALSEALRTPIEERRMVVWSGDAQEQAWLEGTVLAGALSDQPGSTVAVAFNNAARNKNDAFVSADVLYQPGRCPTSTEQRSRLLVSLSNDPPADLPDDNYGYYVDPDAPKGTTRMLVHMYMPVGANFQRAEIAGVETPVYLASERNRPVWWTYVELVPGQQTVIDVEFEEPSVLGVEPSVRMQPMAIPEQVFIEPNRSC